MKLTLWGVIGFSLLFMSCSPIIVRNVVKTYSPLSKDQEVFVFNKRNEIPATAQMMGTVNIKGNGFAANCDSVPIVNRLKSETRKAGGDGLYLSKVIQPSHSSACYQMTGVLLRLEPGLVIDSMSYAELAEKIKPTRKHPSIKLSLNGGYGRRIGKIDEQLDGLGYALMRGVVSGVSLSTSFSYYLSNYIGVGFTYSTYRASTSLSNGRHTMNDAIDFIGPFLAIRVPLSKKFSMDFSIGLGYMQYISKQTFPSYESEIIGMTLGTFEGFGIEYRITKTIGLGISTNFKGGFVSVFEQRVNGESVETFSLLNNKVETLANIDISLGIRIYLNQPK